MMYPFLTLEDDAKIVHSEMKEDGKVKVCIEKMDEKDGFHNAVCHLPVCIWEEINGFTEEEIAVYQKIIELSAHLIIELSQEGGFKSDKLL